MTEITLDARGLSISYGDPQNPLRAVRDVSFAIARGEAYGLIGESGSGKTTVAFSVMDYRNGGRVEEGQVLFQGRSIYDLTSEELRHLRGNRIAMVYQDPMDSLNPGLRIGEQIAEILREHTALSKAEIRRRCVELLGQVHLPDPAEFYSRYPHQLSGGQQQRVVIAMALACDPDLLILDEPTTGLDVTTEAVILDLIRELRERVSASILFISHNIAVVAKVCDRIGVLYAGELLEEGRCHDILFNPRHPYTAGLIAAMPGGSRGGRLRSIRGGLPDLRRPQPGCIFADRCDLVQDACRAARPAPVKVGPGHSSRCIRTDDVAAGLMDKARPEAAPVEATGDRGGTLLKTVDLARWFQAGSFGGPFSRRPPIRAVDGVTLEIKAGRTLAVVGESGSGKSTLARCIVGLHAPTRGQIEFQGRSLRPLAGKRTRDEQRRIQFVFQNPAGSLNPNFTVEEIVARPLRLYRGMSRAEARARAIETLASVNLSERYLDRYPNELSGGEKQRVSIARAIGAEPDLVICDEPTSALDISVQAAVLNELSDLQARLGISYLFISHDLGVVRYIADTVAIMYQGRIVEIGPTGAVFSAPHHPYTEALVAAIPTLDDSAEQTGVRLAGLPPVAGAEVRGCVFAARCPRHLGAICDSRPPPAQSLPGGRRLACHIPLADLARLQGAATAADFAGVEE